MVCLEYSKKREEAKIFQNLVHFDAHLDTFRWDLLGEGLNDAKTNHQ